MQRFAAVAVGMGLASGVVATTLASTPAPGLTKGQAMAGFAEALLVCLQSRERGVTIASLPDAERHRLRPASVEDRLWGHPRAKDTPVWTLEGLGPVVTATEAAPNRCEVTGISLPVQTTFDVAVTAARTLHPDFTSVPYKSGYNPIGAQLERMTEGQRYVVHMEGSEPGGWEHPGRMLAGHAFRFSLLTAYVSRVPVAASTPPP